MNRQGALKRTKMNRQSPCSVVYWLPSSVDRDEFGTCETKINKYISPDTT